VLLIIGARGEITYNCEVFVSESSRKLLRTCAILVTQEPKWRVAYDNAQTNANAIANATAKAHRHSFPNGLSQCVSFFISRP
jgi:hypothetical protein